MVMSGDLDIDAVPQQLGMNAKIYGYLKKPFATEELVAFLRQVP